MNSCLVFYDLSIVAYKKIAYKESLKIVQSDGNFFSANYLIKFQPQFKPLNQGLQSAAKMGLQSVLGWCITKRGNSALQSVLDVGLQSAAKWITKCVRDYKVWQGGLQSASGITKCSGITK